MGRALPFPSLRIVDAQPASHIDAMHEDYIHDIAFDYYGKRLASCSSDQYIKVSRREWRTSQN